MSEVYVGATFVTKPGSEDLLLEVLGPVIEATRAEQGCRFYELFRSAEDPSRFLMWESWDSKEDLDRHLQTPHVRRLQEHAPAILAAPLDIRVLNS